MSEYKALKKYMLSCEGGRPYFYLKLVCCFLIIINVIGFFINSVIFDGIVYIGMGTIFFLWIASIIFLEQLSIFVFYHGLKIKLILKFQVIPLIIITAYCASYIYYIFYIRNSHEILSNLFWPSFILFMYIDKFFLVMHIQFVKFFPNTRSGYVYRLTIIIEQIVFKHNIPLITMFIYWLLMLLSHNFSKTTSLTIVNIFVFINLFVILIRTKYLVKYRKSI